MNTDIYLDLEFLFPWYQNNYTITKAKNGQRHYYKNPFNELHPGILTFYPNIPADPKEFNCFQKSLQSYFRS